MLNTCRLASYMPKGKEKQAMSQQKAIIIATVICITIVVVVLISRKDLCEVRIRSGQTEVAVFTAYESK